ncbi:hypothetical protein ACFL5K_04865 [Gemmatimonadota bacterium]
MKSFPVLLVLLFCLACSDKTYLMVVPEEQMPDGSAVVLSGSRLSCNCFSGELGRNASVFYLGSPSKPNIIRNPSQDWINGYFEPEVENKQFFNSISFSGDTVAVRLFIPSDSSTHVRQAFISESSIMKVTGSFSYSAGYSYPPKQELRFFWNYTDSLGAPVSPGWYAFCTEFVEEDRALLFWFYLVD